jgi:hypothetical protein
LGGLYCDGGCRLWRVIAGDIREEARVIDGYIWAKVPSCDVDKRLY